MRLRALGLAVALLTGTTAWVSVAPAAAVVSQHPPMAAWIRGGLVGRPALTGLSAPSGGMLFTVAAASARRAWAVGAAGRLNPGSHTKALILAWNGRRWNRAATPSLPDASALLGAAAVSARDAWAVGEYGAKSAAEGDGKTLILHWNGRRWTRVRSPVGAGFLADVTARSARDAWAVGVSRAGRPLIIRLNGRVWKRVASPIQDAALEGVAAASARRAWAVGFNSSNQAVILRWNGKKWTRVAAPPRSGLLGRVAIAPGGGAWAVGGTPPNPDNGKAVILRWNGRAWRHVASPVRNGLLEGIAVLSSRSAWAVGGTSSFLNRPNRPVILRWNGHTWTRVASPKTGNALLVGVAATSARNAFAVGAKVASQPTGPLIMRWNGTNWKVAKG